MYMYMNVYIHVYEYTCTCTCMYIHMYINIHVHVHVCTCTWHKYTCTCNVCTYTCTVCIVHHSWAIVKFLTIMIFNRYLNYSEYYHDRETKFGYRFWAFSTCRRETRYSHTSLLEPSNRKTCSSLSRSILSEIFLTIFIYFFMWLWICWGKTMSNSHAHNHMSTIMIVVFTYHCSNSYTGDNNSHTITTITQL